MIERAVREITEACSRFVSEDIDFDGLKEVFFNLPESLWSDNEAVCRMMEIPLYDEDIYDIAIDMHFNISEFVCELIPQRFWEDKNGIVSILDLICDYNSKCAEYVSVSDFEAVLNRVTEEMWADRTLAVELIDKIAEWARGIDDLNCVDQLIPKSFFKDKYDALYVVSSLCNANNMSVADFYLFPDAVWQYSDAILWILSNLEDELAGQGFTMYPAFRGNKKDYISSLIEYIPDSFKLDKGFILELLEHDYFCDGFDLVYDWIDQSLWADGDFVASVLTDVESEAIDRVAKELFKDEKFMSALENQYDVYEWGCELLNDGKECGIALILYAAKKGNPDAISQMAEMYRVGDGVEKNPAEALKLYTMAAENGSSDAQFYLAELYRWGER